jgi:hypothetical protein
MEDTEKTKGRLPQMNAEKRRFFIWHLESRMSISEIVVLPIDGSAFICVNQRLKGFASVSPW